MSKKELNRLRVEKTIKLSVLELGMISIALGEVIAEIQCDDKDGETLLKAYERLRKRISKECKS